MNNDKKNQYCRKVMIRCEEGKEEVFEKYDLYMKSIIQRANIMAANSLKNLQIMVQSEIMKGNSSRARGLLNKRYDVLVNEHYYKLCLENAIPNNIRDIYVGFLPIYC
ncbi:hypothetical protein FDA33_00955 [Clostridium botulinum]|nr:hypothetical protein [Clostridium botulinum]NFI19639.1 hypothetical protein [Clostridium botulinum]NFL92077.1 hypothetical protein [Clostridium botulinum]NFN50325.1 hypothetical protein [Clostridium botulinum]NFO25927.1 hypothetical protein [Clostridium botulinum]